MKPIEVGNPDFRYYAANLEIQQGDKLGVQLHLASVLEFTGKFDLASKVASDADVFRLKVS